IFDHTADVGLRVSGVELNDLFETAAEGVFDYIVTNRNEVRPELEQTIQLHADSIAELLVAWLNELIFRCETQHLLFSQFDVEIAGSGTSLSANVRGESIDRDRHVLDHEVKAVTRHAVIVERRGAEWVAEVILDI